MKELEFNVFENIKHIDEERNEYWSARELQKVLEYKRWDKFDEVIDKAIKSCINSKYNALNHFSHVGKMVHIGSNTTRNFIKKQGSTMPEDLPTSKKSLKEIENYKIIEESEENYERIGI